MKQSSPTTQLLPLVLLFVCLGVAGFIGYSVYCVCADIADKTSQKMEKKNVSFNKDGMRIGVKEKKTESYVDQTQSMFVKAWNYSTWPAYKSRLWNQGNAEQQQSAKTK